MKILFKDNFVDFEAPVFVTEEQRNRIISYLKGEFVNVDVANVTEPPRKYTRTTRKWHKWTAGDYLKLFSDKSNAELADEYGASTGMGPQAKRGTFLKDFIKWKQREAPDSPLTEALIKKFLDERVEK